MIPLLLLSLLLPVNGGLADADTADAVCLRNYQVNENTIIRTSESRELGANYLNESDLASKEECLLWCCQVSTCNVAIFDEKGERSCYLFDCGSLSNFKCKFTGHAQYTSAVLHAEPRSQHPVVSVNSDEHAVALKKLRNEIKGTSPPPPPPSTPSTLQTKPTDRVCTAYQFQCESTAECIAIYNACDGIPQCSDGSDESPRLGCPPENRQRPTVAVPTAASPLPIDGQGYKPARVNSAMDWTPAYRGSQIQDSEPLGDLDGGHQHKLSELPSPARIANQQWRTDDAVPEKLLPEDRDSHSMEKPHSHSEIHKSSLGRPHALDTQIGGNSWGGDGLGQLPEHRLLSQYDPPPKHMSNGGNRRIERPPEQPRPPLTMEHHHLPIHHEFHQLDSSAELPRIQPEYRERPATGNQDSLFSHKSNQVQHQQESSLPQRGSYQRNEEKDRPYYDMMYDPEDTSGGAPYSHRLGPYRGYVDTPAVQSKDVYQQPVIKNNQQGRQQYNLPLPDKPYRTHESDYSVYQPDLLRPQDDKLQPKKPIVPAPPPVTRPSTTTTTTTETITQKPTTKQSTSTPATKARLDERLEAVEEAVEMAEEAEHAAESGGALLALSLGLTMTLFLLLLAACRMRMVKRRMLRKGRSPYEHDADYLVNGMYL